MAVAVIRNKLRPHAAGDDDADTRPTTWTSCRLLARDPTIRPTFLEIMTRLSRHDGDCRARSYSKTLRPLPRPPREARGRLIRTAIGDAPSTWSGPPSVITPAARATHADYSGKMRPRQARRTARARGRGGDRVLGHHARGIAVGAQPRGHAGGHRAPQRRSCAGRSSTAATRSASIATATRARAPSASPSARRGRPRWCMVRKRYPSIPKAALPAWMAVDKY